MYIYTYILFITGDVVFKDSLQFMPSSLDNLVKNLRAEQFYHTRRYWETRENGGARYDALNLPCSCKCRCDMEPPRKKG